MKKTNVLTQGRKRKGDQAAIDGRLEEARQIFEAVCRTDPLDVEAWVKLSLVHKRMGDHAAAESCARRAVTLRPDVSFAHHALGAALHAKGQLVEAMTSYRRAIKLQPKFVDSHYLLGNALQETGALHEAIASYRQALALQPDMPEALGDLGGALLVQGEMEEAERLLECALALQPANPVALSNFGHLRRLQGRFDAALEAFRRASQLAPASVAVIGALAGMLEKAGQTQDAWQMLARGLALAPDDPALNLVAAQLERRDKQLSQAVERLESLCRRALGKELESECRLLLGQIYDQMGEAGQAFPQIVAGKQLKAELTLKSEEDRHRYLARIAALSTLATNTLVLDNERIAPDSETPAFLIGFPRSGTTLLEQVLDSHPSIQSLEERGAVVQMANAFFAMAGQRNDPLLSLRAEEIQQLRKTYFAEVARHIERRTGTLLVDKLPLNIVYVPLIWRVFPQARFILAIRHPCDVCLSCLMQNFAANESMASFFTLEDTVATYVAVMGAWQKYVRQLPLNYHRIRYEDLISNFEPVVAGTLAFLNLPWDEAVLRHTEHAARKTVINTPSYHQVTQPIYQTAKYRWERYREFLAPYLPTLQQFIEYFEYEMSN